ncbi:RDD family protein [Pseudoprimorskyibacter insulae]|uniref:RDD domain-containing protein n=1 Tax=Pseudoprimorskyibacter insulae TaxID=1695997 RepID=A0A2R8AXV4_9RHOB|nr:RDD family protein [Pseudoprimorskyibacter insulae]SPF80694.1 hypothetical protein PRI8871_02505 [Pseudoprimorskyibacter insulae]
MYSDISHLPDPAAQPEFYRDVPMKRALAWLIDTILIMLLVVPVVVLTAFVGLFFLPFLFLIVGFFYRTLTIASGSATWGMRMMSIELRNAYGERLDGAQAFMHTAGYTLSISIFPVQLVSMVLMGIGDRGQGLSDLALGTVMINRRS